MESYGHEFSFSSDSARVSREMLDVFRRTFAATTDSVKDATAAITALASAAKPRSLSPIKGVRMISTSGMTTFYEEVAVVHPTVSSYVSSYTTPVYGVTYDCLYYADGYSQALLSNRKDIHSNSSIESIVSSGLDQSSLDQVISAIFASDTLNKNFIVVDIPFVKINFQRKGSTAVQALVARTGVVMTRLKGGQYTLSALANPGDGNENIPFGSYVPGKGRRNILHQYIDAFSDEYYNVPGNATGCVNEAYHGDLYKLVSYLIRDDQHWKPWLAAHENVCVVCLAYPDDIEANKTLVASRPPSGGGITITSPPGFTMAGTTFVTGTAGSTIYTSPPKLTWATAPSEPGSDPSLRTVYAPGTITAHGVVGADGIIIPPETVTVHYSSTTEPKLSPAKVRRAIVTGKLPKLDVRPVGTTDYSNVGLEAANINGRPATPGSIARDMADSLPTKAWTSKSKARRK